MRTPAAGGTGERVVREPRKPRTRDAERAERVTQDAGEGAASARPRAGDRTRGWSRRLAALLSGRRSAHPAAAPWARWRALWVIPPDDVAIVICGGDLDKAVPEFGAADVLLGLIAADVALEHHVAVVGRAHDFPAVLGQKVEQTRDLREPLGSVRDVLPKPSRIRALPAIGSIELVADRSENVDQDVCRRRRHVREFSRAPLRSGSRRRNPSRSRREHHS